MIRVTLLAIIAGYADTIGYLHLNAFAGLMTGNTIFMGIELATQKYSQAASHALIIVMFVVGVVFGRLLIRMGARTWIALTFTSFLLILYSFAGTFWGALLLALGMGVQNSAANRFAGVTLNHVFITGNLRKLGEELASWIWPTPGKRMNRDSIIFALAWLGYALGAVAGALAADLIGKPLIVAACILPFVMINHEAKDQVNIVPAK